MSDERSAPDERGKGPDLNELRSRLDALQGSVERLGREEHPGTPEVPAVPEASTAPFYASPPPAPYDYSAEVPTYEPPPAETGYSSYAPPQFPPAPVYEPPPAATNGSTVDELDLAPVTILDAGPFADLIELRHFEEAVTRLDTVRDVRVRRFGHNRAKVEIGMVGNYAIGSELYRLGRPMQVELGADGEIIVDFTDVPVEPEPEPAVQVAGEQAAGESAAEEAANADSMPDTEEETKERS